MIAETFWSWFSSSFFLHFPNRKINDNAIAVNKIHLVVRNIENFLFFLVMNLTIDKSLFFTANAVMKCESCISDIPYWHE